MTLFVVAADQTYRPQFMVLRDSLRRFHPGVPILLYSHDLRVDGCISMKPPEGDLWYLHGRADIIRDALSHHTSIVFLGADTELFAPLNEALELLREYEFVAVPHLCCPGKNELATMACGVLNADFQLWHRSGVTMDMLNWYCDRIRRPPEGHESMSDQMWLSLLPALFLGCLAWRTQQHNVAYWNVHEYGICCNGERWKTGGWPLVLYHYSGFVGADVMSKHCPEPTTGDVRLLYQRYENLLTEYGWEKPHE